MTRERANAQRARIPKGTLVTGTFNGRPKLQGATRVVSVVAIDRWNDRAQVCWAGSGGYWHYANLADVELL